MVAVQQPTPASKAPAVLTLGTVAVLTGVLVVGVLPAVVALQLGAQARREARAAAGYLAGAPYVRAGEILAFIGLGLAAVGAVGWAMWTWWSGAGDPDFPATVQ
ncbi:hypothetical protein GCM10010123_30650 [Pilimelia anulata]|uniref:DUF4190 domain-containing protein n=1 Tax=Pilimelia anulata TaxID=53371 RepID=A0A8J3BBA1_9ACTN|nr:hypothetical protein [Pilimelia anulata]GGJ98509.1 hypothetical protein GCM10010123_30650 [Pilimelia anulata]